MKDILHSDGCLKDLWSLGSSKNYWSMCKKLKTVMTACGIEKAISLPLWPPLIRHLGAFKGHAHRECEPGIGTHEHRDHPNLRKNHKPET